MDHAPIQLNSGYIDWGHKPFRLNNTWFKHEEFDAFSCEEWVKLKIEGIGDFILYEKLKCLKNQLRAT